MMSALFGAELSIVIKWLRRPPWARNVLGLLQILLIDAVQVDVEEFLHRVRVPLVNGQRLRKEQ